MTVRSETMIATAADLMTTDLVTVGLDDTVLAAWELMNRCRVHHLPVVHGTRCLGVVDDRLLAAEWLANPFARARPVVRDAMIDRVHCVRADATAQRLADIMITERVTAVPVVDDHMNLIGLVTESDIVGFVAGTDPDSAYRS